MAIIKAKRGNVIYIYEVESYRDKDSGKIKTKWKICGHLDDDGNFIPSKGRTLNNLPAEIHELTRTTKEIRVVEKKEEKRNSEELPTETKGLSMTVTSKNIENETTEANHQVPQEVKALAIPERKTEIQETESEVTEAEIVTGISSIVRSDKYSFGTTKAEGIVFDARKNEGLYTDSGGAVNVSRNEIKRKEINVMVSLDFSELKKEGEIVIAYENRLTPFDRAVYNAIATLWETGHRNKMKNNEYLTPRIIFHLLSGNADEGKSISPGMREAILRSIHKMSSTDIIIDASAEAKAYGYKKFVFDGKLLHAFFAKKVNINGNEAEDCIHILKIPALYDYAKLKNQIGNVDIKMLNIPKFRNTSENIELKEYLLQRIMGIKNAKNRMNESIRYETIYDYLRIEAPTKHALQVKHKKIRDQVKKILDFWKSKKLIRSYREEKEGKIIAKITLTC